MTNKKEVSKYFSKLAKLRHKKNPFPKEHYVKMLKVRWDKYRKRQLSTVSKKPLDTT